MRGAGQGMMPNSDAREPVLVPSDLRRGHAEIAPRLHQLSHQCPRKLLWVSNLAKSGLGAGLAGRDLLQVCSWPSVSLLVPRQQSCLVDQTSLKVRANRMPALLQQPSQMSRPRLAQGPVRLGTTAAKSAPRQTMLWRRESRR